MRRAIGLLALIWIVPFTVGAGSLRLHHAMPLQGDNPPSWCVSVWYPSADSGGLASIQNNAALINVIHAFWYVPLPDGTIQTTNTDAENDALIAGWRAEGLLIIPTIYANTWQMLSDPTVLAYHVDQIVALVEQMNYDGIDIDYESFPLETRDEFSDFIEALSARLHADHKLLSIAVHPKTGDAGTWYGAAAQDWTRLAPAVDIFNIMTYDYTSRNDPPGPISPPSWVHDVLTYAATITDLSKVRMGLPFYGYSWLRDNPPATTTTWEAAQRLIASFHPEIQRDPATMEAQIEVKVRGLPKQTITFADSSGIEYKFQQIGNDFPQLGGVAIWGVGGEDPANWDVLREWAAQARQGKCNLTR